MNLFYFNSKNTMSKISTLLFNEVSQKSPSSRNAVSRWGRFIAPIQQIKRAENSCSFICDLKCLFFMLFYLKIGGFSPKKGTCYVATVLFLCIFSSIQKISTIRVKKVKKIRRNQLYTYYSEYFKLRIRLQIR